jgi:hypothetical protein
MSSPERTAQLVFDPATGNIANALPLLNARKATFGPSLTMRTCVPFLGKRAAVVAVADAETVMHGVLVGNGGRIKTSGPAILNPD